MTISAASGRNPACVEPKETGPCRAAFPRWFFSTEKKDCLMFTYGGCQGNGNNFLTKEACQSACVAADKASVTGTRSPATTEASTKNCPILTTPMAPNGCSYKLKVREDGCYILDLSLLDCPTRKNNLPG